MSKNLFQRLIAILIVIIVWLTHVPSIFKDVSLIILAIALIISTFDIFKSRRNI